MTEESFRDELDPEELLEELDLANVIVEHLSASDGQGIGKRLGGATGEVVGREIGKLLGERLIDPLLSEREEAEEAAEADEDETESPTEAEDDEAVGDETAEGEQEGEITDADDLIEAVGEILADDQAGGEDSSDDGNNSVPDIDSREDLDELSYRDLQQVAKEVGVTANLAREDMTEELVESLGLED